MYVCILMTCAVSIILEYSNGPIMYILMYIFFSTD